MTNAEDESNAPYVLGHDDHEMDRLRAQARFLEPITRQFLREAGITDGMRVLDVRSGAGDVAFLTRELVGRGGVSSARIQRGPRSGQRHSLRGNAISITSNSARVTPRRLRSAPFDAIVGRYVLPFQRDPAMEPTRELLRSCQGRASRPRAAGS